MVNVNASVAIFVALIVDDFMVGHSHPIDDVITNLGKHFKVKDEGLLKYGLNIKIKRNRSTMSIYMSQEAY